MTAYTETLALQAKLEKRGISLSFANVKTLRRAQMTLRRWFELECGCSDNYKSWAIERDEQDEKPYMVIHLHTENKSRRYRVADRENGARRRVDAICKSAGIHAYVQSDPRGCVLYVSREPFGEFDYTNGVPCAI